MQSCENGYANLFSLLWCFHGSSFQVYSFPFILEFIYFSIVIVKFFAILPVIMREYAE
jgi:hypothetical protein